MLKFAACPLDETVPTVASAVQPREAAPISFDDAARLVEEFHYSHSLPKVVRRNFGSFDDRGKLQAAACYGPPVSRNIPKEWLELRRLVVRPTAQGFKLSQFLAQTLRALKVERVAAVISFADPEAGHHGGIYQATNWICTDKDFGRHKGSTKWFKNERGEVVHPRSCNAKFGTSAVGAVLERNPGWTAFVPELKIRYLMPLALRKDKALKLLNTRELPYPKPMWA